MIRSTRKPFFGAALGLAVSAAALANARAADIPLERLRLPEGFSASVFAEVENAMTIAREEIFGPAITVPTKWF